MMQDRRLVLGRLLVLGLCGTSLNAQAQPSARGRAIRVPAAGREAIGRMRGRLEFSLTDMGLVPGSPVFLRVIKDQGRLEAFVQARSGEYRRYRSYRICGGGGQAGPRTKLSPNRISEGVYAIGTSDLRPNGAAYLGLSMGWPNPRDLALGNNAPIGLAPGLIQAGCTAPPHIGLTDTELEDLYTLVWLGLAGGQSEVPVHVFPFAMNSLAMLSRRNAPQYAWWRELEPIWTRFERTKKPPPVQIRGRRFVVMNPKD
jgi:murein L,D-transpeptidase YafK